MKHLNKYKELEEDLKKANDNPSNIVAYTEYKDPDNKVEERSNGNNDKESLSSIKSLNFNKESEVAKDLTQDKYREKASSSAHRSNSHRSYSKEEDKAVKKERDNYYNANNRRDKFDYHNNKFKNNNNYYSNRNYNKRETNTNNTSRYPKYARDDKYSNKRYTKETESQYDQILKDRFKNKQKSKDKDDYLDADEKEEIKIPQTDANNNDDALLNNKRKRDEITNNNKEYLIETEKAAELAEMEERIETKLQRKSKFSDPVFDDYSNTNANVNSTLAANVIKEKQSNFSKVSLEVPAIEDNPIINSNPSFNIKLINRPLHVIETPTKPEPKEFNSPKEDLKIINISGKKKIIFNKDRKQDLRIVTKK